MKEDDHIELVRVGDAFWLGLGQLAAAALAQLPESIEAEATMYLQDKCSIYGTRYNEDLAKLRRNKPTRGVLSKREQVEPTKEAWAEEIAYRANYTSLPALELALDEIVRLHQALITMKAQRDAQQGNA